MGLPTDGDSVNYNYFTHLRCTELARPTSTKYPTQILSYNLKIILNSINLNDVSTTITTLVINLINELSTHIETYRLKPKCLL